MRQVQHWSQPRSFFSTRPISDGSEAVIRLKLFPFYYTRRYNIISTTSAALRAGPGRNPAVVVQAFINY